MSVAVKAFADKAGGCFKKRRGIFVTEAGSFQYDFAGLSDGLSLFEG